MDKAIRNFCKATSIAILAGMAASALADATDGAARSTTKTTILDWSELIQPPTAADQQQSENFAAFAEALANESFSEAEVAAKQMIELANASSSDASAERARALHNLAVTQQLQGSYQSAIQNYMAALGSIVEGDNNLSSSLILPLRGLALAQLDMGLQAEAEQTFVRALHVSNVNFGPHSLSQMPILNAKLQAYLDQGDAKSALDVQDRIHLLYRREYPRDSEELLPLYYKEAALFEKLKMYGAAYNAWRHILIIKQKHHAKNDLTLVEPHLKIAEVGIRDLRRDSFRAVTTSVAEKHLKKALWIAEHGSEDNWQVKKDCLLSLADFYTLFDMKGRARRYYLQAWDLLSSEEEYRQARAQDFENPVPLARPAPYPYANFEYDRKRGEIDQNDYVEGEMVMAFTINDRGRTEDHHLIEADPLNFSEMERRVRNSVESFVYRPRLIDGRPAATHNQQYRVRYYYLPSEYQASIRKSTKRGPN